MHLYCGAVQTALMRPVVLAAGLAALLAAAVTAQQTRSPERGDWPMYRHDLAGTGHSPLAQITPRNVGRLTQAWSYALTSASPTAEPASPNSQATPVVVNGTMYLPAADRVVALDPATGQEKWSAVISGGTPSRRGVAFWPGDGQLGARIFVMSGRRLLALEAANGGPASGFGQGGIVDIGVPYNSVPGIFRNVVVVGANTPPGAIGGVGNPRAYDARTGEKLWEFSAVAQPGGIGEGTWEGESWKGRLGANAWPFYFTFDERRGLVFVPLASPIPGAFGGDRKGANLFGNSVVALDAQTGAYKWHFQTIHHDLWDHDPPAPPSLFDVRVRGRSVPALALTTKSGYLYILNRETGQPIHGITERPVPKSEVPGESAYPTQPVPVKPPALARTGYAPSDLVTADDTTAEHAQACAALIERVGGVANAGPFTPFGLKTTLVFPGLLGGANWGGTAFDPASGLVIVPTQDVGALGTMTPSRPGSAVPYERTNPGRATFDARMGDMNWPCQRPPWGRLTAVHAATGDIAWQVPLGVTEQLPAGKQNTGRPMLAGAISTASGLLFIASTDDNHFRALDTKSGRQLWDARLPRRGNANPLTWEVTGGRQLVGIVATDRLIVYGLP